MLNKLPLDIIFEISLFLDFSSMSTFLKTNKCFYYGIAKNNLYKINNESNKYIIEKYDKSMICMIEKLTSLNIDVQEKYTPIKKINLRNVLFITTSIHSLINFTYNFTNVRELILSSYKRHSDNCCYINFSDFVCLKKLSVITSFYYPEFIIDLSKCPSVDKIIIKNSVINNILFFNKIYKSISFINSTVNGENHTLHIASHNVEISYRTPFLIFNENGHNHYSFPKLDFIHNNLESLFINGVCDLSVVSGENLYVDSLLCNLHTKTYLDVLYHHNLRYKDYLPVVILNIQ